jgi:ubiquinone/menaquinone biosynthesis C-methylase UbiE
LFDFAVTGLPSTDKIILEHEIIDNKLRRSTKDLKSTIASSPRRKPEQKLVDELFTSQSAFWSDVYGQNDVLGNIYRERQAAALEYIDELSLPRTTRVLEIGCGAGFMAIALAERGFTVEAVDHIPAMIELTQKNAKQANVKDSIHTAVQDAHKLTFEDQSFGLIVALGVIAWLHDLRKALTEITRVLKQAGFVVLSIDKPHALIDPLMIPAFEAILEKIKTKPDKATLGTLQNVASPHLYSTRKFNQHLREASLISIRTKTMGFDPFTILNHRIFSDQVGARIQQKLQEYADRKYPILRTVGSQQIILARKFEH